MEPSDLKQFFQPDQRVFPNLKGSRLKRRILIPAVAFLFVIGTAGMALVDYSNTSSHRNAQINTLVDEIGTISQKNFVLEQQVQSQEAVLQSFENDFSQLIEGLKKLNGGTTMFEDLFGDLEEAKLGLTLSSETDLTAPEDSTFDVLILGTNGAHTDTIMVASVNEEDKKISLFSIPRDLYVNGRRINEYYTYYGVDQLERMVEVVTGKKMEKYVEVNLDGFVAVVDLLGGVDVYVEKAIKDSTYPNKKGGYTPYSIEVGNYHMTGEEALKYARSRHSSSDFDRAARQQKILTAVRGRLEEMSGDYDMKELAELFKTAMTSVRTDVALLDLMSYYYDYKSYDLRSGLVLSTSNYLYSLINESGAYILLPKTGNYKEIQEAIAKHIE